MVQLLKSYVKPRSDPEMLQQYNEEPSFYCNVSLKINNYTPRTINTETMSTTL